MPVINVTCQALSKAQKENLIRLLTEASMKVTGAKEEEHIVLIQELASDSIGHGKQTLEKKNSN